MTTLRLPLNLGDRPPGVAPTDEPVDPTDGVIDAPHADVQPATDTIRIWEPFERLYARLGPEACGQPISPLVSEAGVPTQYFERVAFEEPQPGGARLKAIGEELLRLRRQVPTRPAGQRQPARPIIIDLTRSLPRHPQHEYEARPLSHVRYLVIHRTGDEHASPEAIARQHVEANDWPGIGYHFVCDAGGALYQTNDLGAESFHARQFNPVSIGIALLAGNDAERPSGAQVDRCAQLLAYTLYDLGLPPENVRGHCELVPTACPGATFLGPGGWKVDLMRLVRQQLH
jgi:hypothetical protein